MPKKILHRKCSHCGGTGKVRDPFLFGEHMRIIREKSGKSLRDTATAMGITPPYLSDMERGHRAFTDEMVKKFSSAIK